MMKSVIRWGPPTRLRLANTRTPVSHLMVFHTDSINPGGWIEMKRHF